MSDSLWPHGLQSARLPCPPLSPGVCWNSRPVGDAIQTSHPLSSPSAPAFNLFQHQGLFQWVNSSHQAAKVLELQLQHCNCLDKTNWNFCQSWTLYNRNLIQRFKSTIMTSSPSFVPLYHKPGFSIISLSTYPASLPASGFQSYFSKRGFLDEVQSFMARKLSAYLKFLKQRDLGRLQRPMSMLQKITCHLERFKFIFKHWSDPLTQNQSFLYLYHINKF